MIVVSDTTPLNYLVLIDAVDVLATLFDEVYAPAEVVAELSNARAPAAVRKWSKAPPSWLKVADPLKLLPSTARLDAGEAKAISLAKERDIVSILIDERRGRRVALNEGLFPIPTLAVLERAAERSLLDLPDTIEKLRRTTIRVPMDQVQAAPARDAARKRRGNVP